jgi:hypothetical protein
MNAHALLRIIVVGGFVTGILFGLAGVVLVYLGATGETEFALFGQTFESTNAGVGALFISAVLVILLIRRTLGSMDKMVLLSYRDREGIKAPGKLEISDVQLIENKEEKTCTVDFRVSNKGGTDVIINGARFVAIDVVEVHTKGFMEFSKTYDLDISHVRHPGEVAVCPLSQVVKPGEADRIGIVLIGTKLGTGVFRTWRFSPTLSTNFGDIRGPEVDIHLPYQLNSILGMKEMEAREREMMAKYRGPTKIIE